MNQTEKPITDQSALTTPPNGTSQMVAAGQVASRTAAHDAFADYHDRRANSTLRNQTAALVLFARYLAAASVIELVADALAWSEQTSLTAAVKLRAIAANRSGQHSEKAQQKARAKLCGLYLQHSPNAWHGVTWGLIRHFVKWLLEQGYSVATVNNRLAAVKVYAQLATLAGVIDPGEYQRIKGVSGYGRTEAKRIDDRRDVVRVSTEKDAPVSLSAEDAQTLRHGHDPTSPQGARDRLLMCLLLDHGFRVGEVAGLTIGNLNMVQRKIRFYRQKVDKYQTHQMTHATIDAARTYLALHPLNQDEDAPLLVGSTRGGRLTQRGMTTRALHKRVARLGREMLGLPNLSPHDCRHYWATDAAQSGTDPFRLQEAGGWASLDMPRHYIEEAEIANSGVRLGSQ